MPMIGYLPFAPGARCLQADWLHEHLGVRARVVDLVPSWNQAGPPALPSPERVADALAGISALPAVVAEGPAGFLWAALLRERGYRGSVTVLPYVNPRGWRDVLAAALFARSAGPDDRVLVGSRRSAAVYAALGVRAGAGEPYGVDDRVFRPHPDADRVRAQLDLGAGRLLLYAGRAQPDKDLHRLLRVALRARLLFDDLTVVIASHVADRDYLDPVREQLHGEPGIRFVSDPPPRQLADLYTVADVFVTAATSRFETFGRAPAEALCCGCPVVAPRYDGFAEVLDQPGGTLVDLAADDGRPDWPVADEAALLRGVYDVLSAAPPPDRAGIAAAARHRFGRSRTIALLGSLHAAASGPALDGRCAADPVPAASLEFPLAWQAELDRLAGMRPGRALARCRDSAWLRRLGSADGQFVAGVRRALAVAPEEAPDRSAVRLNGEERLACR